MPWNDSSNSGDKPGPKKGGKPNPWGEASSGGGDDGPGKSDPSPRPPRRPVGSGSTPDFNDISRRIGQRFGEFLGRGGGNGPLPLGIFGLIGAAIVALWAASGIYVVAANEQAVVQTFGAYSGWNGPGLNYHLPWPVQNVTKVRVTDIRSTLVGGTDLNHDPIEGLMLTGDKDIVDVQYTVQWRVSRASAFLFNVRDPDAAIKAVAESAMREVVGRNALQPIITTARAQIQSQVVDLMQHVLDGYGSGITIEQVLISSAQPPPQVMDAFRDVQSAEQDQVAKANTAQGYSAQIINQAKGDQALAIQGATGEAAAFNQVYTQYKAAPAVTRQRLYIETMERVLRASNKVIVDSKGATAPIVLPPDIFRPRSLPSPAQAPGAPQTQPQTAAPPPGASR